MYLLVYVKTCNGWPSAKEEIGLATFTTLLIIIHVNVLCDKLIIIIISVNLSSSFLLLLLFVVVIFYYYYIIYNLTSSRGDNNNLKNMGTLAERSSLQLRQHKAKGNRL